MMRVPFALARALISTIAEMSLGPFFHVSIASIERWYDTMREASWLGDRPFAEKCRRRRAIGESGADGFCGERENQKKRYLDTIRLCLIWTLYLRRERERENINRGHGHCGNWCIW